MTVVLPPQRVKRSATPSLFGVNDALAPSVEAAVTAMAASPAQHRGAVFTRREVVEFILDLAEYTPERPLHQQRLLEPCCGEGDFLVPAVERLLTAFRTHRGTFENLAGAIRAVELHEATFQTARRKLQNLLERAGFNGSQRQSLFDAWLVNGDFLLEPLDDGFTHVVGNPPYLRQEMIPAALLEEYRRRYETLYDRADLYVPFIERSLSLLVPGGVLGFICADRWMKNRYGGPLRRMVAAGYRLKYCIDMTDTAAFHAAVSAYPAITVITREPGTPTRVAHRPHTDGDKLRRVAHALAGGEGVTELDAVTADGSPWVFDTTADLTIVRRLEETFPTLEDAGCRVGIGVATGADQVFIDQFDALDVEPDRKLPLAMTRDIVDGTVRWRGYGVINPFREDGGLVRLKDYPKLARYLNMHGTAIRARHVSKKNPDGWYRTIDRITPALATMPKLLIPDIKGDAHIVYEQGELYPHHNLYFITSDEWDLHALQAVLLSGIARLFVAAYSTRMRGGYLRFQAQYLRRIRLPQWAAIPVRLQQDLVDAGRRHDLAAGTAAAFAAYGLTVKEQATLRGAA